MKRHLKPRPHRRAFFIAFTAGIDSERIRAELVPLPPLRANGSGGVLCSTAAGRSGSPLSRLAVGAPGCIARAGGSPLSYLVRT